MTKIGMQSRVERISFSINGAKSIGYPSAKKKKKKKKKEIPTPTSKKSKKTNPGGNVKSIIPGDNIGE